ncbi:MAG: energy transducer TonB [Saprospiraceae bacterium]|nr:energy transducer TonB [Saprospiraceae bacterium]
MENIEEKKGNNDSKGLLYSGLIHVCMILLLAIPMAKPSPPEPLPGDIAITFDEPIPVPEPKKNNLDEGAKKIAYGDEDKGKGNEPSPESYNNTKTPKAGESDANKSNKTIVKAAPPSKSTAHNVMTDNDPEGARLKKIEENRRAKELADESIRKAKEARDAAAKAEEAKKLKDAKSKFGGFNRGGGNGEGNGNTSTPGNQGSGDGDPNSKNLEGIANGSGTVGGGLGGRSVKYKPQIQEKSKETGTVVLAVCVDRDGNILSAEYTQRGSTTTNTELKKAAIEGAKRFKFEAANVDKQCGTITIRFTVK